jgi:DNA-binding CsgD family transcriptional regulator
VPEVKIGISVGTVRFHVKRMFQKTGVRSQAALVSLIRGLASR